MADKDVEHNLKIGEGKEYDQIKFHEIFKTGIKALNKGKYFKAKMHHKQSLTYIKISYN